MKFNQNYVMIYAEILIKSPYLYFKLIVFFSTKKINLFCIFENKLIFFILKLKQTMENLESLNDNEYNEVINQTKKGRKLHGVTVTILLILILILGVNYKNEPLKIEILLTFFVVGTISIAILTYFKMLILNKIWNKGLLKKGEVSLNWFPLRQGGIKGLATFYIILPFIISFLFMSMVVSKFLFN